MSISIRIQALAAVLMLSGCQLLQPYNVEESLASVDKSVEASALQEKLLPKLRKADGSAANASDLSSGGATLLYFSASWCPPCRHYSPKVEAKAEYLKGRGVTPILVGRDQDKEATLKYMEHLPSFLGVMPEDVVSMGLEKYSAKGIPHCVLLNAQGEIVFKGHPSKLLAQLGR